MEQKQRAVIVGCNINNDKEFLNMMEELSKLADACDIEVVGEITQKLERVYSSHYIGKGKVQEVISLIHEKDSDIVIFNDELSPSQIRNDEITKEEKDSIYISAKNKAETDKLVNEICKRAFQQHVCCQLLIPYEKGNILSYFKDNANIKSTEYNSNGVLISMECKESDYKRYKQFESLIKI